MAKTKPAKRKADSSHPTDVCTFEVDVHSDQECIDLPVRACFSITRDDAVEILELAALVKEKRLYCCERFDYRTEWKDEKGRVDTISTDADCLHVTDAHFGFRAYLKHTDVEVLSEHLGIEELAQHFGLPVPAHLQRQAA